MDENEIQLEFIRASGPGGQNVNKVSTAVQLRFDVDHSASLKNSIRQRLKQIAGRRMTAGGILIIKAQRCRTQEQNRKDAFDRFIALIQKASIEPRYRRPTKPTLAAKKRRMAIKRHKSETKRHRKAIRNAGEDA